MINMVKRIQSSSKSLSTSTKVKEVKEIKHLNKDTRINERSSLIRGYVSHLCNVHPYPISFYVSLSDIQVTRMYEVSMGKVYRSAKLMDADDVQRRLDEQRRGEYKLVAVNKCSMRISYTGSTGKEIHGIIATYETKGYELAIQRRLSPSDMCLVWQHGKKEIIDRSLLISKILSTSSTNPKELIKGIHSLQRTQ